MHFTILTCIVCLWPMPWVADTNLSTWCAHDNISPRQIFEEFAVLDTILSIEQRQMRGFDSHFNIRINVPTTTNDKDSTKKQFGTYEYLHKRILPRTSLTMDSTCRLFFAARDKISKDDSCATLAVSLYSIRQMNNMPMVRLVLCRETGCKTYKFITEHGQLVLVIDGMSQTVVLYTDHQRLLLWTNLPIEPADTMAPVSTPPTQNSAH